MKMFTIGIPGRNPFTLDGTSFKTSYEHGRTDLFITRNDTVIAQFNNIDFFTVVDKLEVKAKGKSKDAN